MATIATSWTPTLVPTLKGLWQGYLRLVRDARGVPGVRCGMCDAVPPQGETLCGACDLDRVAAP